MVSTMSATVIVQMAKPAKQHDGSSYRLLEPALLTLHRLSTAALLVPRIRSTIAEAHVLPANRRVTDGARTRDLL
jgi:hypothetical protein